MTTTPKKSTSSPSKGEEDSPKVPYEQGEKSQKKPPVDGKSDRAAGSKPRRPSATSTSLNAEKKHLDSFPKGNRRESLGAKKIDKKDSISARPRSRDKSHAFDETRKRPGEFRGNSDRRLPKDSSETKGIKKTPTRPIPDRSVDSTTPKPSALERFRNGNRSPQDSKAVRPFVKKTPLNDSDRDVAAPKRAPRNSERDAFQVTERRPLKPRARAAKTSITSNRSVKNRVVSKPRTDADLSGPLAGDPSLGIRIQKWLSIQGIASRREAEGWIEEGKVFVNGKLVTEQGMRIDPNTDKVTVLGRHINNTPPPRVYWLLNKPDMVLTSRPDGTGRMSIYDLHSTRDLQFLVSPVGRLDYRTEGLLLLSNDGELVHRLAHPKYKVPRYYNVLIDGRLSYEEESALRRGIELEDGITGKSEVIFAHSVNLGQSRGSWYFITVFEGRNRLVRRMFEHFGFKVVRLVRYGFGDLRLPDDLPAGEYRQLTNSEIKYLKDSVNLSGDV